ncbi:MAG: zinc dependent phospholipase C family protein, partial [Dehalococcoidia bacterium]|nr:zinc dependent phospholipase C family protein [Dehalococcoidia bacterium]
MPPLGMHLTLARELASQLASAAVRAEPGDYYLGASAPDIRALTRWDRRRTHFFDLDDFDEQRGVAGLLGEHPHLAAHDCLDRPTVAFLCGYISHLEMDEAWIVDIYRPCFGERSPLKGDLLANVLDRVLQHELDRREQEDRTVVKEIRNDLLAATVEAAVGFIDRDSLLRWQEVTADVLSKPRTWDRFGTFASRHLRKYGVESEEDLAH